MLKKVFHLNWSYGFFIEPDGTLSFEVSTGPANNLVCCVGDVALKIGEWYHIFGSYDGESVKAYVNGKLEGEMAGNNAVHITEGLPFTIGSRNGQNHYGGAVDEVAFWDEAISVEDSMEPLSCGTEAQVDNCLGSDKGGPIETMGTNSDKFAKQGYLVVKSALCEADLAPLIAVVSEVVDNRATELYNEGVISDIYEEMSFEHRWHAILKACGRENEVFGWHTLVFSEALFDLITHPKVLDVLELLIGSDIQFNGDFWVRPKLPNEKLTTLPWHQDSAYMPHTRKRYAPHGMAAVSRC